MIIIKCIIIMEHNVHVLRYLNAVSEFTDHKCAKEMHDLLLEMNNKKQELISNKKIIYAQKNMLNINQNTLIF